MIDYKSLEVGDLTAASINRNIHKGTIVKGIIYDTSKDSDGGAWRKRCQDKSWYTETLGGTNWLGQVSTAALAWAAPGAVPGSYFQNSTDGLFYQLGASSPTVTQVYRGNVREFPAVVAIIAESSRVVIYDLTQSGAPMWFVAKVTFITSLAAMQGRLVVGRGPSVNMLNIEFVKDYLWSINNLGTTGLVDLIGSTPVHTWTGLTSYAQDTSRLIASASVNDVALTVLDTAPIDPSTGLPVPTIAVATAGGVSVIKDDGTVVNSSHTGNATNLSIAGSLLWTNQVGGVSARLAFKDLLGIAAAWSFTFVSTPDALVAGSTTTVGAGGSRSYGSNAASGSDKGAVLLKNNPATPAKGMVAYITNTYNSGWLPGDSRGAYLADTTAETVAASGELVTNGTFTTDTSGWTATNSATFVMSGAAGLLTNGAALNGFAYQTLTTVIGKSYVVTANYTKGTSVGGNVNIGNSAGNAALGQSALTATGIAQVTFVATATTTYISLVNASAVSTETSTFDNISVKLAEPDRSVKNTGLVINGTLTKAAVASGAGLAAYTGMNTSNYLEQPFSTNLDFSTGDFCYMGWVYNAGTDHSIIHRGPLGVNTGNGVVDIWTYETAGQIKALFASVQLVLSAASNTNHFVAYVRTGGVLYGYVNGVLAGSIANTNSMTLGTSDSLYIGKGYYSTGLAGGLLDRLALWRISATAPSADQIAHIYRTELPLFQPNAKCTIDGTSTSVTALAYDDVADELHVGTSWGRSEFKDLLRVASEATTTGAITSISANEGVILTGGTSAKVYAPAMYLRDELRRKDVARKALGRTPVFFDHTATASQTAFVAPKGYTIKALYKNGTMMRETTTGTYWTRSHDGFQETATLSVGASVSDWVSIMCVRS